MLDQNDFQGGVFSKQIPNGRASATISLDVSGLRALTSGNEQYTLSYNEINLEMGGDSGKVVFCRNTDRSLTIFCEEKGFLSVLEQESAGELREQIEQARAKRGSDRRRGFALFWGITATCLLLLVGAYFGIKAGARAAVHSLPFSVDEKIGELSQESMQEGFSELKDEQVVAAIQQIVDRLAPHSAIEGVNYQVRVIDSPIMNAYALPGGYITVFTGLIDESDTPEEVAGVIAHEMAHVTKRHGLERISGQVGIIVGVQLIFGDVSGLLALGVELGKYAAQNSYSRDQETEADLEGARMLHEAGIDPLSVVPLFEDLAQGQEIDLPEWMSTHPDLGKRVERLKEYSSRLPEKKYQTFEAIDWKDIKSRVNGLDNDEE